MSCAQMAQGAASPEKVVQKWLLQSPTHFPQDELVTQLLRKAVSVQ